MKPGNPDGLPGIFFAEHGGYGVKLQLNTFAYKAFGLYGLKNLRQGNEKVLGAFYGVVENYDGTRFKIWNYVACAGITA